jgi:hypothetical protein
MNYPFFITIKVPGEEGAHYIAVARPDVDSLILTTTPDHAKAFRMRDYSRARELFASVFDYPDLVKLALLKLDKKPAFLSYSLHRDDPRSSKMVSRTYYFK